jgi:nucleoside-diphosphate-sugar epimerase
VRVGSAEELLISTPRPPHPPSFQATFGVLNAARRHSAAVDSSAQLGLLPAAEQTAAIAAAAAQLGHSLPAWSKALQGGAGTIQHVVYASSSSVYGETDGSAAREDGGCADKPLSMYAASKRSTELLASSYGSMFHLPSTGLRFFTVYGNHGRPDMAVWKFSDAVLTGRTLTLTATTEFKRDFTHVSDIVDGIVCIMLHPPSLREKGEATTVSRAPARALNIGRADPSSVDNLIKLIESAAERKAVVQRVAALNVDVTSTHADVSKLMAMCGKSPATPLAKGVTEFVQWYKAYMTGDNKCGEGWAHD